MGGYGTPESATKRGGYELRHIRDNHGWTRNVVIGRLHESIDPEDPEFNIISESWLKRIEDGNTVKIRRYILDKLCEVLECTPEEYAKVVLSFDRNILPYTEDEPMRLDLAFNFAFLQLHADTREKFADLFAQLDTTKLPFQDLVVTVQSAMELVLIEKNRQGREMDPG